MLPRWLLLAQSVLVPASNLHRIWLHKVKGNRCHQNHCTSGTKKDSAICCPHLNLPCISKAATSSTSHRKTDPNFWTAWFSVQRKPNGCNYLYNLSMHRHALPLYTYEIAEKSPQQTNNECSHNLMRVTHKVAHHHHTDKLLVTTYWLHQLPTVAIDKCIMIHPWSGQTITPNLCPEFLLYFWKATESLMSVTTLASPAPILPEVHHVMRVQMSSLLWTVLVCNIQGIVYI